MIGGRVTGVIGVPNTTVPSQPDRLSEWSPVFEERNYTISGVTRNATGSPLGFCTVKLFSSATDTKEQTTTSDASGSYSFVVDKTQLYWTVEYLVGAPDVAGTSVNTLAGS
jgi:hypothetical protein